MEERTGWRGQNESQQEEKRREMADFMVLPRPAKSVQNGKGFSGKIEHTGPAEKERVASVPQRQQLARTPEPPLPKGKQTQPSVRTLARKRGIRARAWSGKVGLHRERGKIPRRKGRASKKSLPRTSRRKHEWVSGRKISPGRSAESWFYSTSGQT